MGLILLEAALALAVLVFLIWWTMFSGRRGGELHDQVLDEPRDPPEGVSSQDSDRGGTRKDIG